jgi:hypothetical protein
LKRKRGDEESGQNEDLHATKVSYRARWRNARFKAQQAVRTGGLVHQTRASFT